MAHPSTEPESENQVQARRNQLRLELDERSPFDPAPFLVPSPSLEPIHLTKLGALYDRDCMEVMRNIVDGSIDTVFADPPFNIGKEYRSGTNDNQRDAEYEKWCREWLAECVRIIKPGGAFFLYHLPKWNLKFGSALTDLGMDMRHWIAIELNLLLPIPKRLYPCHYSLLYFTKGSARTFHRIRTPIETCRHCKGELKDYGGYRNKMNPNGVTLKDIWHDIPPVRHSKFKVQGRKGVNALSTKVTDRAILMSTNPGDIVFDPFGGSGTTYVSAERFGRNWLGTDIDYAPEIVERLESDDIKPHRNGDWVED